MNGWQGKKWLGSKKWIILIVLRREKIKEIEDYYLYNFHSIFQLCIVDMDYGDWRYVREIHPLKDPSPYDMLGLFRNTRK